MSDTKPSNPQVFPIATEVEVAGRKTTLTSAGMTLRDLFAGMFYAARLSNPSGLPSISDSDMAKIAYQRADAMLRAREEA